MIEFLTRFSNLSRNAKIIRCRRDTCIHPALLNYNQFGKGIVADFISLLPKIFIKYLDL